MDRAPAAGLRGAGDRRRYGGRGHLAGRRLTRGTLIRHAPRNELEASTVGALVVAVVEAAQLTGLVAGTRRPQRPPTCLAAKIGRASCRERGEVGAAG